MTSRLPHKLLAVMFFLIGAIAACSSDNYDPSIEDMEEAFASAIAVGDSWSAAEPRLVGLGLEGQFERAQSDLRVDSWMAMRDLGFRPAGAYVGSRPLVRPNGDVVWTGEVYVNGEGRVGFLYTFSQASK